MNLHDLLHSKQLVLGDGSMYELLRRSPEVEFDAHIAHSGLIYNERWAKVLERVMREYLDVAVTQGRPMLTTTATWRANRERIAASAFAQRQVNFDNAVFLRNIVDSYGESHSGLLVGGSMGPRGDAYNPSEALDADTAAEFHASQVNDLVAGGVDFLQAATLPALSEAIGIARVMAQTGVPYIISFVVEKSGGLLDGTPLDEAIRRIDDEVRNTLPPWYAVNCVHPTVLQPVLDRNPDSIGRVVCFSGNTSARSVDELDGLEELDAEAPHSFAAANHALVRDYGIRVVGGCCGTSPGHIRAIAELVSSIDRQ